MGLKHPWLTADDLIVLCAMRIIKYCYILASRVMLEWETWRTGGYPMSQRACCTSSQWFFITQYYQERISFGKWILNMRWESMGAHAAVVLLVPVTLFSISGETGHCQSLLTKTSKCKRIYKNGGTQGGICLDPSISRLFQMPRFKSIVKICGMFSSEWKCPVLDKQYIKKLRHTHQS